jgi:glycosyltransferase involved in cell wall biosynthesis
MLESIPGTAHERLYLSAGRAPGRAVVSLPARLPRLGLALRRTSLVHTHGDAASSLALPVLRMRPAVMTTHGLHLFRRTRGPERAVMKQAIRSVAAAVRVVICTSASERDELAEIVRLADSGKLTVIQNGVDAPPALVDGARQAIRDKLGCGPGTVLGLFAGRLEARKAPLLAAAAARRVRESGAPFVLAVAGEGPQAPELRRLAGDAVLPLGHRPDLPRLLAAADVFVQPSEREGMSLALLDAMAHGLAVVAADGPGNPEAIGDAGLLFAAGDEPALVAALIRLSLEPDLRASLGTMAGARAREQFGAERFVAQTRAVYAVALDSSGALA